LAKTDRSLSAVTFSKPNYLEILPIGVNKAKALVKLANTLGVKLSQVAALGDGPNDVEMLTEAGIEIAMGNASEAVKSEADWITGTNDEDGVAQAVRRLVINGKAKNGGRHDLLQRPTLTRRSLQQRHLERLGRVPWSFGDLGDGNQLRRQDCRYRSLSH
jgi:haloacid dehalogenase-like hydrolase